MASPERVAPDPVGGDPHAGSGQLSSAPLDFNFSDAGNAEYFVSEYGDLVRFDHARRRWLVWDLHRWRPDADAAVHRMALESVRKRRGVALDWLEFIGPAQDGESQEIKALRARAKKTVGYCLRCEERNKLDALLTLASRMKPVADDGAGWDATPGLLGVPNGVVDLRTGELRDGRREDRITMQAGVAYDPEATCPRFRRFLREVLDPGDDAGADEMVRFARRLMATA